MKNGDPRLKAIHDQTVLFIAIAWVLVGLGFIAAYFGFRAVLTKGGGFSLDNLALYGSYLQGSVAAIWSLATLLFIYVAFLGQREQLIRQDEELKDQQEQFRLQQDSIRRQNFESSFFQLLNLHNKNTANMNLVGRKGREAFMGLYSGFPSDFEQWLRRKNMIPPIPDYAMRGEVVRNFCNEYFQTHLSELGHYFATLYHVIKFVKESDVADKRRYTSLVRAQLSKFELHFLFYNCLSKFGEGFKPLAEEFGLFEHLDTTTLLHPGNKELFNSNAFE